MSITVLNKNFHYNEYGVEITSAATLDEIKKELKSLHSSGELLPFAYGDILIHLRNSQDKSKEQFVNNFLSEDKNRSQLHNYIRVAENFDNKERTKYLKNLTFTHLKESLELTKDKSKAVALLNVAIQNGIVPNIYGMDVINHNLGFLGTTGTNTTNLVGVALDPRAAIIASRTVAKPQGYPGYVENVTDADSGLTLQARLGYDILSNRTIFQMQLLYGVAVGNTGCAYRVTSA